MAAITVVTAAVVDSGRRGESSRQMVERLVTLKAPTILRPFAVTHNDEIQGVLAGWFSDPKLIRWLRFAAHPSVLHIGISWGQAEPGMIARSSNVTHNQAFYRSRQALSASRKTKQSLTLVRTGSEALDDVANSVFTLLDAMQQSWTDRQWQAIHAHERYGTFDASARHLGIKPQSVQKLCSRANWRHIRRAEETLTRLGRYGTTYFGLRDPG